MTIAQGRERVIEGEFLNTGMNYWESTGGHEGLC